MACKRSAVRSRLAPPSSQTLLSLMFFENSPTKFLRNCAFDITTVGCKKLSLSFSVFYEGESYLNKILFLF